MILKVLTIQQVAGMMNKNVPRVECENFPRYPGPPPEVRYLSNEKNLVGWVI